MVTKGGDPVQEGVQDASRKGDSYKEWVREMSRKGLGRVS